MAQKFYMELNFTVLWLLAEPYPLVFAIVLHRYYLASITVLFLIQ